MSYQLEVHNFICGLPDWQMYLFRTKCAILEYSHRFQIRLHSVCKTKNSKMLLRIIFNLGWTFVHLRATTTSEVEIGRRCLPSMFHYHMCPLSLWYTGRLCFLSCDCFQWPFWVRILSFKHKMYILFSFVSWFQLVCAGGSRISQLASSPPLFKKDYLIRSGCSFLKSPHNPKPWYPMQVWGCCCTTTLQGETFFFIPSIVAHPPLTWNTSCPTPPHPPLSRSLRWLRLVSTTHWSLEPVMVWGGHCNSLQKTRFLSGCWRHALHVAQ